MNDGLNKLFFTVFIVFAAAFPSLCQPLNGTYTIGGVSPDYATFNDVVTALQTNGVNGPVTFNVRDGVYNEQVSIDSVTGTSSSNTIIFQSESGDSTAVTLTHASITAGANYTLLLNGVGYSIFQKMTIRATNSIYARAVVLEGGAINNLFSNNVLEGISTTSGYIELAVVYANATTGVNTNNTFSNNYIKYGSYGLEYTGGDVPGGLVVSDNIFTNQYTRAIDVIGSDAVTIVGNEISTTSISWAYVGIFLLGCDQNITVTKNRLSISKGCALSLQYCDATSGNPGLIANNFIHVGGTASASAGIFDYYNSHQNFYYNSVRITNTHADSHGFSSVGSGLPTNNLQNNILSNEGGGYAIYTYDTISINTCDYNDLYVTGANLGNWAGVACTSLVSWKAVSGKDANSVTMLPGFTSNTDLHLCSPSVNNKGIFVADVTTDIDLNIRSQLTPDIGADEYDTSLSVVLTHLDVDCYSICDGIATATTTGGTTPYTYSWSNGQSALTATGLCAGSYTITVTDVNGCIGNTVANITSPSQLITSVIIDTATCDICADGGADLTAAEGTPPYTYNWSNGASTEDLANVVQGTYYVTVTDAKGCFVIDTAVVNFITGTGGMPDGGFGIEVYPNPNKGRFGITITPAKYEQILRKYEVRIINVLGQEVLKYEIKDTSIEIDLGDNAKGMYMYRLFTDDKPVANGRIIVE